MTAIVRPGRPSDAALRQGGRRFFYRFFQHPIPHFKRLSVQGWPAPAMGSRAPKAPSRPNQASVTLAMDDERNRIARDLHDAVTQTLFACNLLAGALARQPGADETVRDQAQVLERLNRSALAEMRMMLFELRPDTLAGARMADLLQLAVAALVGRGGVQVHTEIHDHRPIDGRQRAEVYRVAQAVLSNIARHSGASQVHLQWHTPLQGPAQLRITDDGCGFELPAEPLQGTGLAHIRQRARALKAELHIRSAPSEGTDFTLTLTRKENLP